MLCFGNSKEDELGKWWGSMDYHHYGGVGQGGGDYFVVEQSATQGKSQYNLVGYKIFE